MTTLFTIVPCFTNWMHSKLDTVECVTDGLSTFLRSLWIITVQSHSNMECISFISWRRKNCSWWHHLFICPPIDHKNTREPIKMHVEFSLLYKIFLIIEMRSKIFNAKGGTAEWFQVLNIVDTLSMTKVIHNRKLWLISFLQ